jgi:hypothetical protein
VFLGWGTGRDPCLCNIWPQATPVNHVTIESNSPLIQMFPVIPFTAGKLKYRDLSWHYLFVRECLKHLTCRVIKIKAENCGMPILSHI